MAETNQAYPEDDARHHTAKVRGLLNELIEHLREDEHKFTDPTALALFETTAEVLKGLDTAFEHFETRSEVALSG